MILVDTTPVRNKGRIWFVMVSDQSLDELHTMDKKIGLRREWLRDPDKMPHYEIVQEKRAQAIQLGARPAATKEIIQASERLARIKNCGVE